MNKTDKFRSDMVTENIELKKELKLVSEQLQAVNNGCVELKARLTEIAGERDDAIALSCGVIKDLEQIKARWEKLKKWLMASINYNAEEGDAGNESLVCVNFKMHELESGGELKPKDIELKPKGIREVKGMKDDVCPKCKKKAFLWKSGYARECGECGFTRYGAW